MVPVLRGLFVAGRVQPNDTPDALASELGAATRRGDLLFERSLPERLDAAGHYHSGPERDRDGVARVT